MIVTESVKHPTATENVVQKSLMNSCSDTHTPISDQDYNMTRGTVILQSPCARVRASPADRVKFEPVFCVCRPARAI